ncbi:transmembrane signal peptide protein [Afipia carboxidovorans OM5]|nr:transmembrane signal peptide protein [Afipia carboxidovorans OM5]
MPSRASTSLRYFKSGHPMPTIPPAILPIVMLFASNCFMTFAWYGHLRFKTAPLALVVMASWGIALFEYWLAVPANRWGSAVYSPVELKTIQEVITLIVFAGFSALYLKEPLGWNHAVGFALIAAGAFLIFQKG